MNVFFTGSPVSWKGLLWFLVFLRGRRCGGWMDFDWFRWWTVATSLRECSIKFRTKNMVKFCLWHLIWWLLWLSEVSFFEDFSSVYGNKNFENSSSSVIIWRSSDPKSAIKISVIHWITLNCSKIAELWKFTGDETAICSVLRVILS